MDDKLAISNILILILIKITNNKSINKENNKVPLLFRNNISKQELVKNNNIASLHINVLLFLLASDMIINIINGITILLI